MTEFQSDRFFELWKYTASHGQLLLRANKTNVLTTRVEILFKDVLVLNLIAMLKGVSVDTELRAQDHSSLERMDLGKRNLYRVSTENFAGYVVAASFYVHEDELDFHEPSALLRKPYV